MVGWPAVARGHTPTLQCFPADCTINACYQCKPPTASWMQSGTRVTPSPILSSREVFLLLLSSCNVAHATNSQYRVPRDDINRHKSHTLPASLNTPPTIRKRTVPPQRSRRLRHFCMRIGRVSHSEGFTKNLGSSRRHRSCVYLEQPRGLWMLMLNLSATWVVDGRYSIAIPLFR
jgi:hypothetical protein